MAHCVIRRRAEGVRHVIIASYLIPWYTLYVVVRECYMRGTRFIVTAMRMPNADTQVNKYTKRGLENVSPKRVYVYLKNK